MFVFSRALARGVSRQYAAAAFATATVGKTENLKDRIMGLKPSNFKEKQLYEQRVRDMSASLVQNFAAGSLDQAQCTKLFNSLLSQCRMSKAVALLHDVETQMQSSGCPRSEETYKALLIGYSTGEGKGRGTQPAFVANLAEEVLKEKWSSTISVYNTIVEAFTILTDLTNAEKFKLAMEEEGISPDIATYKMLITAAGAVKDFDKVREYVDEAREQGISLDKDAYETLIALYGRASRLKDVDKIFQELKEDKYIVIGSSLYNALLLQFCAAKWAERVDEVRAAMDKKKFQPNTKTVLSLIRFYRETHSFTAVDEIREEMVKRGIKMDEDLYNQLLGAFCAARQFEKVEQVYEEMQAEGCKPTGRTFVTLVDGYGKVNRMDLVEEVLEKKLPEAGVKKNIRLYNTLLNVYGKAKDFRTVEKLLGEMKEAGIKKEAVTYSTLVDVFGKGGKLEKVQEVIAEAENDTGFNVKKNTHYWNSILNNYRQLGMLGKLEETWKKMVDLGIKPDFVAYNIALLAHCRAHHPSRVEEILGEMRSKGLKLDGLAYSHLIDMWATGGHMDRLDQTVQAMEEDGVPLTPQLIDAVMRAYASARKMDKLQSFLVHLETTGMKGRVELLTTLVDVFAQSNKPDTVDEIVDMALTSRRHELTAEFFQTAVRAYRGFGNMAKVQEMLQAMDTAELKPTTYVSAEVTRVLVEAGNLEAGERVISAMPTSPGGGNFRPLLVGYGKKKDLDKVEKVWKDIQQEGITPSVHDYSAYIRAIALCGKAERVYPAIEDMLSKGYDLGITNFHTLLAALGHVQDFEGLGKLLEVMEYTGAEFSVRTYVILIGIHAQLGNVEEVEKLLENFLSAGYKMTEDIVLPLIQMYGNADDVDKLVQLEETIHQHSGVDSERLAVITLANQYATNGLMDKAEKVLLQLQQGITTENEEW